MSILNTIIADFLEAGADETEPPTPDFNVLFPECECCGAPVASGLWCAECCVANSQFGVGA